MEYAPVSLEFSVKFSFIEIYLEKIRDLLDSTRFSFSHFFFVSLLCFFLFC
jgi:hypothetical protein